MFTILLTVRIVNIYYFRRRMPCFVTVDKFFVTVGVFL